MQKTCKNTSKFKQNCLFFFQYYLSFDKNSNMLATFHKEKIMLELLREMFI